jgi:hypothetical protein
MTPKQPSPPLGFKKCKACAQVLPLHCFNVRSISKDGYTARCSPCRTIIQRYKRKPEKFHPVELPVAICNEAILSSLLDSTKYTFSCRGGFVLMIDFTRDRKKVDVSLGDDLILNVDFQQADTKTCLKWIQQYLFDNEIWIVPE